MCIVNFVPKKYLSLNLIFQSNLHKSDTNWLHDVKINSNTTDWISLSHSNNTKLQFRESEG